MNAASSDSHTTFAVVDLDAIAHNVQRLAAHIGPRAELFAVVKANAYGHGALQVSRVALESGAARLAVARLNEGVALRQAGIDAPILVMGYAVPGEVVAAVRYDLTVTVNTIEVAQALAQQADAQGKAVAIHIKVDSGMGRFGLLPEEVLPFVEQLHGLPRLDLEGIFTHFAVADLSDKTYTRQQFATFADVLKALEAGGYTFRLRHAANSAATLDLPEMHLNAVRVGLAMYGLHPSDEIAPAVPLRPALSLKSHVARVRTLPAGASISYGRTYITTRAMPVALVPVGYGDGYHRILSNRGHVLIRGQRAPIVGRVCMDQFVVDVTGIEGVSQDDEVVLIGSQGGATVTAEEVAALAETINYEVTTSLLPRVPRLYLRHGQVVEWVE
jgi:alanine racemase